MTTASGIRYPETEGELRQWERGWADMMVTIWTENILRLGIVSTGGLMKSLTQQVVDAADRTTIVHQFLLYGIYVARGVGNGYRHGNPGDLEFLGKSYRKAHKLGKAREKRDWFARKYLRSLYVLAETERNVYGEMFMGNLSNVVQAMFGDGAASGSAGTDVTSTLRQA